MNALGPTGIAGTGLLLEDHGLMGEASPRPAVFLRHVGAQEAGGACPCPQRALDVLLGVPMFFEGGDFGGDELPDVVAEQR